MTEPAKMWALHRRVSRPVAILEAEERRAIPRIPLAIASSAAVCLMARNEAS